MDEALTLTANPSSVHADGREGRRRVEAARRAVAALVGAQAAHVVFTSGATEAASLVLSPEWRMGRSPFRMGRLYVCAADHPCTLSGGRFTASDVETVPVGADGVIDLAALRAALGRHDAAAGPPLVAVHAANNETGVLQPVGEVCRIVRDAGGVLVVDAVQAAGRIALDISEDYADFLILSSHKIGGAMGAGALVGTGDVMMPLPLLTGGGQERGHRAGTENMPAIAAFGAAAAARLQGLDRMSAVAALRDRFEAAVLEQVPDAEIHGRAAPRLPNTLFFSIPGLKAETAQIAFDLAGVSLSAGSACSSGKVGPSHVLRAMGRGEDAGALRVSIGPETGSRELDHFGSALAAIAERRRTGGRRAA